MNRKRLGRLLIVLFLLAALPGMTAAMAQGQEPVGKQATAALDVVVSETPVSMSVWESEPNDTMAQANQIDFHDVYGAQLYPDDADVDFYKFFVSTSGTGIVVNTDARIDGEPTDTVITVYNAYGDSIASNDDVGSTEEERDSLLYLVLSGGWYFVKVTNYDYVECGAGCYYSLMVHSPLLLSAAAANLGTANIEGIPFRSEDILAFAKLDDDVNGNQQHKWLMFLDGSDIGFTKPLVNLSTGWECISRRCPSMAVSFSGNLNLIDHQGIARTVKPWDWIVFLIDRVGPNSSIGDIRYYPGKMHGLTTSTEKLDALYLWGLNDEPDFISFNTVISTVGAGSIPKDDGSPQKLADEDLLGIERDIEGGWHRRMYLDASTVTGMAVEDVIAIDIDANLTKYLTILGTGNVLGHRVTQKDIFALNWANMWDSIAWHGPDWGWNYNIDAFDWPGY